MKFITIFFLFLSFSIHGQVDFEFFELNKKSEAKALIQRQIDTIEVNNDLVLQHYEFKQVEIWDTAFVYFRIIDKSVDITPIQGLGKVITETILVKKSYSVIQPINCGIECYDKYPVQKEVLKKSALWINQSDLLNEKSWVLYTISNQIDTVFKYGINAPYNTKTIEIPACYITIKRFIPNENLSKTQFELINKICPIKRLPSFKTYDYKKIPKTPLVYPNRHIFYDITQNATIKKVKILTKKELRKNIISIKKALINHGYSVTLNRKIDDEFKRVLMQFQMENDLPIGQFDLETVGILVN